MAFLDPIGGRYDPQSLKVFVGALPGDAPEGMIRGYFAQFGVVKDVIMFYKNHHLAGRQYINKGFCHIVMTDPLSVQRILSRRGHRFYGRTIVCSPYLKGSHLKRKNQLHDNTRVMIKNFPLYVTEPQLKKYMARFGETRLAYFMVQHANSGSSGKITFKTASVQFTSEDSVKYLLSNCPIYFDSVQLWVEAYVYKQQKPISLWVNVKGIHNKPHIQRSYKYGYKVPDGTEPNFSEQEDDNRKFLEGGKGINLANEEQWWNELGQAFPLSWVKPTSSLFSHSSIYNNHVQNHNLLYRLLQKPLSGD